MVARSAVVRKPSLASSCRMYVPGSVKRTLVTGELASVNATGAGPLTSVQVDVRLRSPRGPPPCTSPCSVGVRGSRTSYSPGLPPALTIGGSVRQADGYERHRPEETILYTGDGQANPQLHPQSDELRS